MTTQTVSNAVARRDEQVGPVKFMWTKRAHFRAVLPGSVDVEMFLGTAAGALYASDKLMEAARLNPDSLMIALMECATLGHRPGTEEYYLTPRKDHGKPKVLGIEGYRGVIERMYRSGAVSSVVVREVCANDRFRYVEGADRVPHHEVAEQGTGASFFARQDRGEMVGVYAYAELLTGAVSRVVLLTRDDVLAARDSGGYKPDDGFSPWDRLDAGPKHPEFRGRSMWWKTGAKRLEPWVPTSSEYRREQLRASAAAVNAGPRPAAELPAPPDDGVVDAEIVDEQPAQPERPVLEQPHQRRPRGQRQQGVDTSTGEVAPPPDREPDDGSRPPAPATSGQVGMIREHFARLGYGEEDRDARLRATARLARIPEDRPITSTKALTEEQAARVREALAGITDAVALAALLDDLDSEVPSGE